MISKINNSLTGLTLGLIAPLLVLSIFYLYKYNQYTPEEFYTVLKVMKIESALISLCVIANLALFFIVLQFDFYNTAKGIIFATFIYSTIVVYLKFF